MAGWLVVLLVALALPALAYLDPGSGNLIAQLLAGCVAAVVFSWNALKARVTGLFGGQKEGASPETSEVDAEQEPSADELSQS